MATNGGLVLAPSAGTVVRGGRPAVQPAHLLPGHRHRQRRALLVQRAYPPRPGRQPRRPGRRPERPGRWPWSAPAPRRRCSPARGDLATWQLLVDPANAGIVARRAGLRPLPPWPRSPTRPSNAVVAASCARPGVVGLLDPSAPVAGSSAGPALPASLAGDTRPGARLALDKPAAWSPCSPCPAAPAPSWPRPGATPPAAVTGACPHRWPGRRRAGHVVRAGARGRAVRVAIRLLRSRAARRDRRPRHRLEAAAPAADGTATVAFTSPTTVDALAVDNTVLTVWTLPPEQPAGSGVRSSTSPSSSAPPADMPAPPLPPGARPGRHATGPAGRPRPERDGSGPDHARDEQGRLQPPQRPDPLAVGARSRCWSWRR